MRHRRWLVVGCLGMLSGTLIGLGVAIGPSEAEADRVAVAIPAGTYGDVVEYVVTESSSERGPDLDGDASTVGLAFTTRGPDTAMDGMGVWHETFRVDVATVPPGGAEEALHTTEWVHQTTRELVQRAAAMGTLRHETGPVEDTVWTETVGTALRPQPGCTGLGDWRFRHQAATIALGTDLGLESAARTHACAASLGATFGIGRALPTHLTHVADGAGRWEGRDTIAIRFTVDLLPIGPEPTSGAATLRLRVNETIWIADGVPYPVEWERQLHASTAEGTTTWVTKASLVGWEPGDSPLAWKPCGVDCHGTALETPLVPREGPVPQPGDPSPFRFSMEEARARLEEHPALDDFHRWRASHPDHRVVGASYSAGLATKSANLGPLGAPWDESQWFLTYGDPSGSAYKLTIAEHGVVTDARDFAIPPDLRFDEDDLATSLIPWSDALTLWSASSPPGAAVREPNLFLWGYFWLPEDPDAWAETEPVGLDALKTMRVRYLADGLTPEREPDDPMADRWLERELMVDGATGRILRILDMRGEIGTAALPLGQGPASEVENQGPPAPAHSGRLVPVLLASGSLLGLGLLGYAAYRLLRGAASAGMAALPGYAKIRQSAVLDHPLRRDVVALLGRTPGLDASQVRRRLGTPWSTLIYHLGILERHGLLSSVPDGRHRRLFLRNQTPPGDRGKIAVLHNRRTRTLAELVRREPGLNNKQVAERLGVSEPGVYWHARRLESVGLLRRVRVGGEVRFEPAGG